MMETLINYNKLTNTNISAALKLVIQQFELQEKEFLNYNQQLNSNDKKDILESKFLNEFVKIFAYSNEGFKNLALLEQIADQKSYFSVFNRYQVDSEIHRLSASLPLLQPQCKLNVSEALLTHTYTDLSKSFMLELYDSAYDTSQAIRDILTGLVLQYIFKDNDTKNSKILVSGDKDFTASSEFDPDADVFTALADDGKNAWVLIHELSHFFMSSIFKNDALPYTNDNSVAEQSFNKATRLIIEGIARDFLRIGLNVSNLSEKSKSDFDTLIQENPFIELFYLTQFKAYNIKLVMSMEKEVDSCYANFFEQGGEELSLFQKYEKLLDIAADIIENHGYTTEEVLLLQRVAYAIYMPDELTAVFVEFQMQQRSEKIMKYFKPLEEFWFENITPQVASLKEIHNLFCSEFDSMEIAGQNDYVLNNIDIDCIRF